MNTLVRVIMYRDFALKISVNHRGPCYVSQPLHRLLSTLIEFDKVIHQNTLCRLVSRRHLRMKFSVIETWGIPKEWVRTLVFEKRLRELLLQIMQDEYMLI